jgi:hypothetical protein
LLTWYNNLMALARTWQLFDAIQECFVFHRIQDSRVMEPMESNFGTWMSSLLLKGL